ncbi:MAG: serpin family protein [Deltaproteobacteria bacterium]|nr:serpin family protein [Deltaproteobacteria bacterium]
MKNLFIILISLLTLISTWGCTSDETEETILQAKSELSRNLTPDVSETQLGELVSGNTEFALNLYEELVALESGNIFYSPHSISIAMAMTWAGALGDTASQMADVLQFGSVAEEVHAAFNALDLELSSRGTSDPEEFRLEIANAIWGQDGYGFLQSFLDTLALNYGSGLFLLDFFADPENSRITINDWVAENTEDRIKDLLPEGSVTNNTKLVLTNAIYFKADWNTKFHPDSTYTGEFTQLNDSKVSVDMMNAQISLPHYQGANFSTVEMPYKGEDISMVVILPDEGEFENVEAAFNAELLSDIDSGFLTTDMILTFPKFSYEYKISLKDIFVDMGMTDAFDFGKADLSGMDGTNELYIMDVLHKAFVAVDEEGTEAAAATGVIVGDTSIPSVTFNANRPFIYLIRDRVTGAILFVGRVVEL